MIKSWISHIDWAGFTFVNLNSRSPKFKLLFTRCLIWKRFHLFVGVASWTCDRLIDPFKKILLEPGKKSFYLRNAFKLFDIIWNNKESLLLIFWIVIELNYFWEEIDSFQKLFFLIIISLHSMLNHHLHFICNFIKILIIFDFLVDFAGLATLTFELNIKFSCLFIRAFF